MPAVVPHAVEGMVSSKNYLFIPVPAYGIFDLNKNIGFVNNAGIAFFILMEPPLRVENNEDYIVCQLDFFGTRTALFG